MNEVWILTHIDSNPYNKAIIGVFSTAEKALLEFEKFEFSKEYPIFQKSSYGNIAITHREFDKANDYYYIDRREVK